MVHQDAPRGPSAVVPDQGLRARKREQLRTGIQNAALVLFARNGYEATTVEQVAEEVGVSARTVHRYFPHKQDLVTYDRFNPVLRDLYRAQPATMRPIRAVQESLRRIIEDASVDGYASGRTRLALLLSGGLGIGAISDYVAAQRLMSELVAERMPDRDRERADVVAAALTGVVTMVVTRWLDEPTLDAGATLDEALDMLAAGGLDA